MFDRKEYMKEYHIDHREKRLAKNKQWRKDNPEYNKQYYQNNNKKINEYRRRHLSIKYKTNLKYNLNERIRSIIKSALKDNKSGLYWEKLVGYTLKDLIKRLKNTIPEGYCWEDYLNGKLQIDHKIPISAFNFTTLENPDFKKCWALSNLRLLPERENLIKGSKLLKPFQLVLKI